MPRPKASHANEPRPFVKWAGGKGQILPALEALVPDLAPDAAYHEPFLGGGALFFRLAATGRLPGRAFLSDSNEALVTAFACVRDHPDALARGLAAHAATHSIDQYYRAREAFNEARLDPLARATLMIYLNRAGFNGLWRVNASGKFNVPCGRQAGGPAFPDRAHLRACARALAGATLRCEPFERVLERAAPGDCVYFDPPYVPVSRTAFFTAYTEGGFGQLDQERLRDVFGTLAARGCHVLLSNSDTPDVRLLYADHATLAVSARRAINSKATARGPVGELIVRGGPDVPRAGRAASGP